MSAGGTAAVPYHDIVISDSEEDGALIRNVGGANGVAGGIVRYTKGKAQL